MEKREYTEAEIATAKEQGITVEWLGRILDTYMDKCREQALARRQERVASVSRTVVE